MGFKCFKVELQFLAGTRLNRLGNFHGHFCICVLAQSPELFAPRYLQCCGVEWLEWVPRRGRKWGPGPASHQLFLLLSPGHAPPAASWAIAWLAESKGTLLLQHVQLHISRYNAILIIGRKKSISYR